MADVLSLLECPRCGKQHTADHYGPCEPCRIELRRIYADRNRVRIAALAHLRDEDFNAWMNTPNEELNGDTPWGWIDAGFTDQVIELVKAMKRTKPMIEP